MAHIFSTIFNNIGGPQLTNKVPWISPLKAPNAISTFSSSMNPSIPSHPSLTDLSTEKNTCSLSLCFSNYFNSSLSNISSSDLLANNRVRFGDGLSSYFSEIYWIIWYNGVMPVPPATMKMLLYFLCRTDLLLIYYK